ncbi:MAG: CDP-alcohol phosphatidyltransferase family protein [Candidatus Omnitrophota bacterium]|nr:CDP-alcohol phosphatidyltransferase family protein [Candidatus Omnitrophota bacterium]
MNFANKISIFRILTVPFFIACFIYYTPEKQYMLYVALGIFILAAISDAADGYIARKSKQTSRAGMILDPLGDKLMLMSAFICLNLTTRLAIRFPLWVILVVVSRDLIILLGVAVIYMVRQKMDILPTRWGKLTTASQIMAVLAVLLQLPFAYIFWDAAVFFTVLSGMDYIKRGFKVLYAVDSLRNTR